MMGTHNEAYSHLQNNWGPPEELLLSKSRQEESHEFDPAAPMSGRAPQLQPTIHARPASSLYTMCLRVILRNLVSVQDLGDMPWRNAKPILEACRVDQLITLEEASPHLLEHSEEIWRRNCLQDFMELRKLYSDNQNRKEPKSWRRLYFKTRGQIEKAKGEAAQRIKDKYAQHKAEKESKRLVVSDRPLMKARTPTSSMRRFGTAGNASKGQSLLNKARSGSVAQAKLTAPRNPPRRSLGRSQAAAAEMVPVPERTIRPMVAPKTISPTLTDGLIRMREFVKPIEIEDGSSNTTSPHNRPSKARQEGSSEVSRGKGKSIDFFSKNSGSPVQIPTRGVKRPLSLVTQSPTASSLAPSTVISASHTPLGATADRAIEITDVDESRGEELRTARPTPTAKEAGYVNRNLSSPSQTRAAVITPNKSQASVASLSSIFAPTSSRGRASLLGSGTSSSPIPPTTFTNRPSHR